MCRKVLLGLIKINFLALHSGKVDALDRRAGEAEVELGIVLLHNLEQLVVIDVAIMIGVDRSEACCKFLHVYLISTMDHHFFFFSTTFIWVVVFWVSCTELGVIPLNLSLWKAFFIMLNGKSH